MNNAAFFCFSSSQDRGVKEDELQSILNYLLTMHEVNVDAVRESAGHKKRQ